MVQENEIGSFVFRNEGNGNLSGEFINKLSEHPFQEMCHLFTSTVDKPFIGKYNTSWYEEKENKIEAILIINCESSFRYDLEWSHKELKTPIFKGIGMLYNGLLIGAYWDA